MSDPRMTAVGEPGPWWHRLAGLEPLEVPCSVCRAPAIIGTPHGFRCLEHPPVWGRTIRWGDRPPGAVCLPGRCYCGRCPWYTVAPLHAAAMSATDLKNDRARNGGKRGRDAVSGPRSAPAAEPGPSPHRLPPVPRGGHGAVREGAPATSHAAAARMSGLSAGTIRGQVFEVARDGATDEEVERVLGRKHQSVSAARNALVAAGYLEDSGARRPTSSGQPAIVWRATPAASHL